MSNRNLRALDRAAGAAVRIAKRRGVQIDFINPGDDGWTIGLWAFLNQEQFRTALRGGQTDSDQLEVFVARQSAVDEDDQAVSWPPSDIHPGAKIRFTDDEDANEYQIDTATPDAESLETCATVRLVLGRFGITAEM